MNNFVLSDTSDIDSLKSALAGSFPHLKETSGAERFEIYDTFDWRLYHSGWHLVREGNRYVIACASSGQIISGVRVDGKKDRRFGWDFPASDFTDRLAPVLEMRALIPVADIEKSIECLAVCNTDKKTVARIELASLGIAGGNCRVFHCRLLPLKGYGRDARNIRTIIKNFDLMPATEPAVSTLLKISGIDPGAYSSKVNVALKPEMSAPEAVQLILKNLVAVMHQNLDGVRKDIDTEFLHDLRVAIRRARSLIGQTKGVLDAEITAMLQAHLKTIGGVSGKVRDLDVYLLEKEAYVKKVPASLRPGILQLFRTLQRRRHTARNRMIKEMEAADFENALTALDDFLQSDTAVDGNAENIPPIGELARIIIYKRFRRILRNGGRISKDTPDEKLHELRIECKKLRYLLEFFTSLFPVNEMKRLIKQLKGLQENLGDFNDLSVQQEFLADYLKTIKPQTPQSILLAAATGGLITRLSVDHQRVRSEFLSVFETFSSKENKARFKSLFS